MLCAMLIIQVALASAWVALFLRASGPKIPCKWPYRGGIYKWLACSHRSYARGFPTMQNPAELQNVNIILFRSKAVKTSFPEDDFFYKILCA